MERGDTSLHNADKRTGLRVNGSSINKNKNKKINHTYNQVIKVNNVKHPVLPPVLLLLIVQEGALDVSHDLLASPDCTCD